jgi:hypothetical protein
MHGRGDGEFLRNEFAPAKLGLHVADVMLLQPLIKSGQFHFLLGTTEFVKDNLP